jgi:hypothetical protein
VHLEEPLVSLRDRVEKPRFDLGERKKKKIVFTSRKPDILKSHQIFLESLLLNQKSKIRLKFRLRRMS